MQVSQATKRYHDSGVRPGPLKLPFLPARISRSTTLVPTIKQDTTEHTAMHAKAGIARYRDPQSADSAATDTSPAARDQQRTQQVQQLERQVQQRLHTGMMPAGFKGRAVVVGAGPAGDGKLAESLHACVRPSLLGQLCCDDVDMVPVASRASVIGVAAAAVPNNCSLQQPLTAEW